MIPLTEDQIEDFTPNSLVNVAPKPVFRFRAATEKDTQRYSYALDVEGLERFTEEQVRGEVLRVLRKEWTEDTFNRESQRLETAWALMDQKLPLDPDEQAAILKLTVDCMEVSPTLRMMNAKNKRFNNEAPALALGLFLAGWKNLETPFRLEAGQVPYGTLSALRKEIFALEERAAADKVEGVNPGLAFMELSLHAFSLMSLTKDEEKNSSAPSPSSETPSGSPTETKPDGASEDTTSAPTKTRRKKSPKATATS